MKRNAGFNVTNFLYFLFFLAVGYLCYIYVPMYFTKNGLSNLVRDECFAAKAKTVDQVREQIKRSAVEKLNIDVDIENIQVERFTDRIRAHVIWIFTADLLFKEVKHRIRVDEEVIFY